MKQVIEYIENNKSNFENFEILSDKTIQEAENKFAFKFDDDLKEFFKYSRLDFESMELCNISADEGNYLNAYSELNNLKENNFKLPSDKIIPLENYGEFYVVYSFGDQNDQGVYLCTDSKYQKDFDKLEDFLLVRFKEEENS